MSKWREKGALLERGQVAATNANKLTPSGSWTSRVRPRASGKRRTGSARQCDFAFSRNAMKEHSFISVLSRAFGRWQHTILGTAQADAIFFWEVKHVGNSGL